MRLKFYASQRFDKEDKHYPRVVSSALVEATKLYNDDFEVVHNATFDGVDYDVDVACLWGITGNVSEIVSAYTNRGKHAIIFDKALIRHQGGNSHNIFRVGIDGPSPVKYLMRVPRGFERFERRRVELRTRLLLHNPRPKVIYCGSSQKYCDYYKLGDANDYAEDIFKHMRSIAQKMHITYRPKPSWQGAREIPGSVMSNYASDSLKKELVLANLLVTHGSAAAVEAIIFGVPIITLGPCAAQFVANREISNNSLFNPYFPSEQARWQWLCNLAYCQWDESELRSGEAWGFIRNELIELGMSG